MQLRGFKGHAVGPSLLVHNEEDAAGLARLRRAQRAHRLLHGHRDKGRRGEAARVGHHGLPRNHHLHGRKAGLGGRRSVA